MTQLLGLVLSGGRSRRMQRDKALLDYHGVSQLEHACRSLEPHVAKVYVSIRADQQNDPLRSQRPVVVDAVEDGGPIAGIMAAQAAQPNAAWWVLACDLPFLDSQTLLTLLEQRDSTKLATAFRSSHDGLPEPLCAIYEPASRAPLAAFYAAGGRCPRKFLREHGAALLAAPSTRALDNINSPDEYQAAVQALRHAGRKALRVQYFALLRDQAKRSDEQLESFAATPRDLYSELRQRYRFTLDADSLRVAINAEFADWAQPLKAGDEVVFIPPVAGG
jgi:molybdopterin-guanine dinucleotide biosynthesis protein A